MCTHKIQLTTVQLFKIYYEAIISVWCLSGVVIFVVITSRILLLY